MLPIIKRLREKRETPQQGLAVSTQPIEIKEEIDPAMEAHAVHLLMGFAAKDPKMIAEAIRNMFELMDSQPHVEGEHIEPHSFAAQNIKAGRE